MNTREIITVADLLQQETSEGDVFGKTSYIEESERLRMLAGKLHYKAEKDPAKSSKLKEAARMILLASDILKSA